MSDLFANFTGPTSAADVEEEKKTPAKTKTAAAAKPVEKPVVEEEEQEIEDENREPTELELLRERAGFMSLPWSEDTTVEELKAAINAKLDGDDSKAPAKSEPDLEVTEAPAPKKKNAAMTLRKALVQENMRLVRLRITNLDPKDKDLFGQIYTVDNEYLGTVSRFIPFGEATDNGTHIEYCLYKLLRSQKFLQIKTVGKGINARQETSWVRKFALEILPPLTDKELDVLKASQLASGAVD